VRHQPDQSIDDAVGLRPPSIGNERQPLHSSVLPTALLPSLGLDLC
jgi:hypothetical protein